MRRHFWLGTILAAGLWSASASSASEIENIERPMAVAGQFYPAEKVKLSADIEKYLSQAGDTPIPPGNRLVGLVCPHAGYTYSAPVAAWSYRLLSKLNGTVDLVIIIGSSHHTPFRGVTTGNYKAWKTPLGELEVDAELVKKLMWENDFVNNDPVPHLNEHCIEVQLPFIKSVLPDAKIVPILMGMHNKVLAKRLAAALSKVLDQRKAVIIFSTDLSHYQSYDKAVASDKKTTTGISLEPADEFFVKMDKDEFRMCGGAPVSVMKYLQELRGCETPALLKYMNSGDTGTDKSRVVGYAAMVMFEDPNKIKKKE